MTDDAKADAVEAVNRALASRGRPRGGAGGQTMEGTARSTFHEISAWDLETILDALTTHAQAEKEAAVAAEREACAKVAEYRWREWSKRPDPHGDVVCDVTACENIASAIRARGDTDALASRDARVKAEALREAAQAWKERVMQEALRLGRSYFK